MRTQDYSKSDALKRLWKFEIAGFASIVIACWITEAFDPPFSYSQVMIQTLVILLVAIFVIRATNKLVRRIRYLEGFMHICAWCKRVRIDDAWSPIETLIGSTSSLTLSHGICPTCVKQLSGERLSK